MVKVVVKVTRRGAYVARDSPLAPLVRKELTVAPLSLNDPFPKRFKCYLETPGAYVVPHYWVYKHDAAAQDSRVPGRELDHLRFQGSLRADLHQPEAVKAVEESWAKCGGAMLCLPPGYGKTSTALYLACQHKAKTLILVHKSFLKDQWIERIRQFVPGATVGEIQGDTCTDGDFVIAMIQTLLSRRLDPATFAAFKLVCVDEAHHVGAPAFSQVMWGLNTPLTLGLTGTPHRKDGLSRVIEWYLGPIAYHVRRENQRTTEVRIVKYDCEEFQGPPPVNRRGDICYTTMVTRLVENTPRSHRLVDIISDLASRDLDVLVLSHRRAHCFQLTELLRQRAVDAGSYVGGDKECPAARVVCATYALTSEGFDLPRLNALVLATPASDVEQSCARVMRGSATRGAVIVDVVDQWGPCFAMAAKRRGLYKRSGFTVHGTAGTDPAAPPPPPQHFAFISD